MQVYSSSITEGRGRGKKREKRKRAQEKKRGEVRVDS